MFKKMKENKKKGFTLVELIVVLVILAILAALLIPALTGYIDKAKNKSVVAETRQIVMAAQTIVDEQYAKNDTTSLKGTDSKYTVALGDKTGISNGVITISYKELQELSEVKVNEKGSQVSSPITINEKGKITELTYTKGNKVCKYQPGNADNSDGDYHVDTTK